MSGFLPRVNGIFQMRRTLGVPHIAFGRFQLRQRRRHGAERGAERGGLLLATGKHHAMAIHLWGFLIIGIIL